MRLLGEVSVPDGEALCEVLELLRQSVGVAYGLDTQDRNNIQTCIETIRPGPKEPAVGQELSFVRRMCLDHRERV